MLSERRDNTIASQTVSSGAVFKQETKRQPISNNQPDSDAAGFVNVPIEDSIDLHAFAPRDVQSVVDDYVTAAHAAGLREVRLIHGRGKGVQRGLVQQALDRHPLVVEFWDAPETHLGATVARLAPTPSTSR